MAADNGFFNICRILIANRVKKDPRTNNGYTPLHMAAGKGHLNICTILIANGAKKDPRTNDGSTPLDLAAKHKQMRIVAYFRYLRQRKMK